MPADRPAVVTVRRATADRWHDLEALFGERGACGGCWCQFWNQPRAQYLAGKGEPNHRAFRRQVEARRVEVARQTRQVSWLQNNPEYLGIYARDKFDLMKEGETVFRMEPTKPERPPVRSTQSPPE